MPGLMQALGHRDMSVATPGVTLPAPRATAVLAGGRVMELVAVATLAAATVLSRLLTRSHYLFNWDSIQFALGVQRFDLAAHRPHPPGYLGYVLLGRLFGHLAGGSAADGLVLLSALASGAVAVAAYAAARETWGRLAGWSAAVLFVSSPLAWIYGSVALTYALDPLLGVLVLWMGVRACRGEARALVIGAVVAGLAGAIRPTDEVFLAVPLLWAAYRTWRLHGTRPLILAATAITATTLAWLVPLLALSGGPARYLLVSRELSARASDTSAVWKTGLSGLGLNGSAVVTGLVLALGILVPLGLAHVLLRRLPASATRPLALGRDYSVMALALLVPTLAVYVLVHIGQLGYLLLPLPALLLPAGVVVERVVAGAVEVRLRRAWTNTLMAAAAAANVALFALPPGGMLDQVLAHDRYTAATIAAVQPFDPATTVLVTGAEAQGSYRLAQYYLGAFPVVAVGLDEHHHAGEIFSTRGPAPEYDLARFHHAGALTLPAGTRTVVLLDQAALDIVGDRRLATTTRYGDGWRIWVVRADPSSQPVAAGGWIYLRGEDCPCRGASSARMVPAPGTPR